MLLHIQVTIDARILPKRNSTSESENQISNPWTDQDTVEVTLNTASLKYESRECYYCQEEDTKRWCGHNREKAISVSMEGDRARWIYLVEGAFDANEGDIVAEETSSESASVT